MGLEKVYRVLDCECHGRRMGTEAKTEMVKRRGMPTIYVHDQGGCISSTFLCGAPQNAKLYLLVDWHSSGKGSDEGSDEAPD
jgi:hypothetical protein